VGGIFKSTDGGASWKKLAGGLPGLTGRIGLAVFRGNPKILYAIVQTDEGGNSPLWDLRSKRGGVFRSENGGKIWERVNPINPRSFYFSQIRIDPANDKRIYVLGVSLHVSEDGGRTFREDLFKKVHPDCHALAIDPDNPDRLLLGTDGGPYLSLDGGKGWEHLNNFAAGEFYRINLDMSRPYRICGGLQDNLNWVGPSATPTKEGIRHSDWTTIGGGDGFYCLFDPEDPDVVYAESQQGWVYRFDMRNGQSKGLRPSPAEGQPAFRYHWNSPLVGSTHEKGTMYLAGNRVFRLTERGEHWTPISPDLSTRDPEKTTAVGSGAENYGVVYALAESPLKAGFLWAGTDDGKVWITENGGRRWTDLTEHLPASLGGEWISHLEASSHDPNVAYLSVDAHRTGSYAPLLFRTEDRGKSWSAIASDLPAGGPVKVVREDPENPDLLYAGTEFGLYVSLDRGGHWIEFGELPTVAVDHLAIHPRELDLVIATHGRSLYIVDDLRPLQGLTGEVRSRPAHLFPPRGAFGSHRLDGFADWNGNAGYRGANPPEGAILNVWVREFTGETVELAIEDAFGKPVANLSGPGTPGINRIVWDLKPTEDLLVEYGGEGQKFVAPGRYTIKMTYGTVEQTETLDVEIAEGVETR
jgi:photosystem II stability/assembly factor-like uncharacterized protein